MTHTCNTGTSEAEGGESICGFKASLGYISHHKATENQVCGSLHPLYQPEEKLLAVFGSISAPTFWERFMASKYLQGLSSELIASMGCLCVSKPDQVVSLVNILQ